MNNIETMKQWLEALEYPLNQTHENFNVDMAELLSHRAIESLRQAIEQAQQAEPVALKKGECWPESVMQMWDYYRKQIANGHTGSEPRDWFESLAEMRLVDTSPPPRQPLTDEEIAHATAPVFMGGNPSLTGIARAIESAHGIKEKNT